ncbi:MAG TPA: hypothetical protein VKH43_02215 [Thermoanaerobaculia bacterium]|nr:hypothetical protein [Thermoanaerobaculia bacterium]
MSGLCGPFIDVPDTPFCRSILEIFTLGITVGTTPTTYTPDGVVNRLQAAVLLSRTIDSVLDRGSRAAALGQFWNPGNPAVLGYTTLPFRPISVKADGENIWVSNPPAVSRVRASDGKLLESWTGAPDAEFLLVAMGKVFVTGLNGSLYQVDPAQPAGSVTAVVTGLGAHPFRIAYDGGRIWTANINPGSISIISPGPSIPWTATTITAGFTDPNGILYDGSHIWVTEFQSGLLKKVGPSGAVLQTVTLEKDIGRPAFDGANLWVPTFNQAVLIVRAADGRLVTKLRENELIGPSIAAFDGRRMLIWNADFSAISLWRASDMTPIGAVAPPSDVVTDICSDGLHFWLALPNAGQIARF